MLTSQSNFNNVTTFSRDTNADAIRFMFRESKHIVKHWKTTTVSNVGKVGFTFDINTEIFSGLVIIHKKGDLYQIDLRRKSGSKLLVIKNVELLDLVHVIDICANIKIKMR
jgi:hypothetical protein